MCVPSLVWFHYQHKHRIHTVERFVLISNDRYAELIKTDPSVINSTDIDQIKIFKNWYTGLHKT